MTKCEDLVMDYRWAVDRSLLLPVVVEFLTSFKILEPQKLFSVADRYSYRNPVYINTEQYAENN